MFYIEIGIIAYIVIGLFYFSLQKRLIEMGRYDALHKIKLFKECMYLGCHCYDSSKCRKEVGLWGVILWPMWSLKLVFYFISVLVGIMLIPFDKTTNLLIKTLGD